MKWLGLLVLLVGGCGPSLAAQQARQRTAHAEWRYDNLRQQWLSEGYELRSRCRYRADLTPGQQAWCSRLEGQHDQTSDLMRIARDEALDSRTAEHRNHEMEYAERAERARVSRDIQEATQAPFRKQAPLY